MNYARLATLVSVALLLSCQGIPGRQSDQLHVMLQGSSSTEIAALVEQLGGEVTHDLQIIGAVGAKLTPGQFDQALQSDLITFHIEDLDTGEAPDPEEEESKVACNVRGHIELNVHDTGFSWSLYNKKDKPAYLEELKIEWPGNLGNISSVTLGDSKLETLDNLSKGPQKLELKFAQGSQPIITDNSDLTVIFEQASGAHPRPLQRDFTVDLNFVGGCSSELVPGYENNHEDYYYNTVAGVDQLQLQGITGEGVTVAVIDSGLWEHPALTQDTNGNPRVLAFYDAELNETGEEVLDPGGHGSHMTSIIANSSPTLHKGVETGFFKGVAPDVNLVVVKALDPEGRAHILDIARAAQWVVDNREAYDIKVLNMSLAQRPRWPYWEDPVTQIVMRAWAAGITVVAAASNEGPDPMSIGSPGNLPYIITVGAITDSWTPETREDDYIPDFSSRGPTPSGHVKPDIVALGGHMTGLAPPDSNLMTEQPEDVLSTGELTSTGSSQSAAMVSGIVALMLQLEPGLTPDQLKCKLITSAEPAINRDGKLAYSPFQQGYGYVTAPRTVTLGNKDCGSGGLDIAADIANEKHFYGPTIAGSDGEPTLPDLEEMVSSKPSAKGLSSERKWGIKAHIERLDQGTLDTNRNNSPWVDWLDLYMREKETIEKLSRDPSEH
jgi:serine protease AprX